MLCDTGYDSMNTVLMQAALRSKCEEGGLGFLGQGVLKFWGVILRDVPVRACDA